MYGIARAELCASTNNDQKQVGQGQRRRWEDHRIHEIPRFLMT